MASNVTTGNLVWAPGNIYYAPLGSTEPVGIAAPAAPWVAVGATNGGVKITFSKEYDQLDVDQVTWDSIESRVKSQGLMVETSLAELTHANLTLLLNGGASTDATTYKTFTPSLSAPGTVPTYGALLIDSLGPSGKLRRLVVRKSLSTKGTEMESKKDAQSLWSVTFTAHWIDDSTAPYLIIDGE